MPEYPNPKLREVPEAPVAARSGVACAELGLTSNFSFLRGASHPDELVFRAAEMGYRAVGITDRNTLAGVVRAHSAAKQAGLKLLIGTRLSFTDAPDLLVWATDRAAYGRLCNLLTIGKRRTEKGECELKLSDFIEYNQGLLGAACAFADQGESIRCETASDVLGVLRDAMGDRLSLAVCKLYAQDDVAHVEQLVALSRAYAIPLLATNDVHYHDPSRRALQDVLSCVRHGCTIHEAGYRLFPNGERYLKSPEQMRRLFQDIPRAIDRGIEIAERCPFSLDELRYEYPDELAPAGKSPIEYLTELTWHGAAERYPNGIPEKVRRLIEHELVLIEQLRFEAYFLTVYDLVRFARSREILCQGRGSAANSAVCYCIGVTSVDPAKIDLLFERFVSRERNEPPDIDIDFEHERREEMIQYLYEKYGRQRAGMTAEVITYRGRSAVRDVGKALGLSLDMVEQMANRLDWWHRGTLSAEQLREVGLDPADRTVRQVVGLTGELLGFPRHLGQHVGGMVMTRGPLCELIPIENASMPDRTVIEWDKDDIDELGILKVDVLALGMLTCIAKAFGYINGSDEATERRSDEGANAGAPTEREGYGNDSQNVSGLDCMAEEQGADESTVRGHASHAGRRAIRSDQPDAPCRSVDSVKHCRGTCEAKPGGLSEVSPHRPRIVGGVNDAGGDRLGVENDCLRPATWQPLSRGGSRSPGTHPQPGEQIAPIDPPHPPLRRSVAPSLRRSPLQLHTIPPEDPLVYDMICDADTVGVFQIESRAQMSMLPRLRPRCFYDLVIEVAIVRPGPIQGNMVHPYLRRRSGEEKVDYPSEALRQVLEKTLGVPLFQEQAMRVAMVAASFSAGEADQLRRAMAAWRRKDGLEKFYHRIIDGMLANGYTREFAEQCFNQIKGFGEYGFPESHAASFALLVYVSSWLKRHHPAAFCAALLNSQPMGFYAPAQIVRDAKEHGVEVRAVDVNESEWDCGLERRSDGATERRREGKEAWGEGGPAVRLGFRMVRGLHEAHGKRIGDVRRQTGRFDSVDDFQQRAQMPAHAVRRLAEADAFGSIPLSRRPALWEAMALKDDDRPLFDSSPSSLRRFVAPSLDLPAMPLDQEVMADYATAGLSLKKHPVSLLRDELSRQKILSAEQINRLPQGRWVKVAGLVLIRQRPGTASGIVFATIEDETGVVNLIIMPDVYDRYRLAARHASLLRADGYVERQGQVVHVKAKRLYDLSGLIRGYRLSSRDFH